MEGVSKSFGPKTVLDDTDLWVARGETMVIMGRSGEGKSVLLKNMVRLLEPDAGRIWIEGVEVTSMDTKPLMELRKKFGFLFQGAALFDSMTVGQNVAFGLKGSKSEMRARVDELLEEFVNHGNGKLVLKRVNPAPFSEEEDQAAAFGLQAVPVGASGATLYLGIAASNSTTVRNTNAMRWWMKSWVRKMAMKTPNRPPRNSASKEL